MKNIKPSELIELALHDLEVVESMPDKYSVNMAFWHMSDYGTCEVCLAGAVMAVSLHVPIKTSISNVEDFKPEFAPLLRALNFFRTGHIRLGLAVMGISRYFDEVPVCDYAANKEHFKRDMRGMAEFLKSHDL
jgi:hypothetical protein